MSDEVEETPSVRYDTLGRRIPDNRRGPAPGSGRGRSNPGMLQARLPLHLLEQVDMIAKDRPRQGSLPHRGRSSVVIEALTLYFQGDAVRWQRRYLDERARRIAAELRLERAREALQ